MTDSAVEINIVEVKTPDTDATLVAENIAAQLELHCFRRAMKQCVGRTMRMGAKGIKITCWRSSRAALKSLVAKAIAKAAFLAPSWRLILTMALQKHIPLMAASA